MSDTQDAIDFLEASDNSDLASAPAAAVSVTMSGFREFLRNKSDHRGGSAFTPDLDYERQDGIRESLEAVRSGAPVVFISGRAGTGKSRLINYMKSMPGGQTQVVVAPTGVAALALKAATIHSFFRLPIGVIAVGAMEEDQRFGPVIRKMRRLVIDEISMVRADVLDGIDARLRMLRNPDRPFGGVQIVMVGDFLQLPPVVTEEDRTLLSRLGYETPFAFSARVMQNTPIRVATLKKVWRQSDPEMISALGAIREGRGVEDAVNWLNARCARDHRPDHQPLLLTARRDSADAYNEAGLSDLRQVFEDSEDNVFRLTARSGGSFENERSVLPAPRFLELYPGARVMSVKNDGAGEYVNGSLGEVVGFHDGHGVFEDTYVSVLFDGASQPTRMFPTSWTKTQQAWNEEEDAIEETVSGFFEQVPLVVGYAITIHKSQGLTLEDVRIDLGKGAFAPGQLYVALSRAKSIEGLSFVRDIAPRDVQVDEMLVRFLEWAKDASNLDFATDRAE
jgi:ATP-dependent exoDNAse (exonuclease V) alpha subunit